VLSFGLMLALICALLYTAASLFLKGAIERGATSAQVSLVTNLTIALITQPLWLFDRPEVPNAPLWQPLFCSLFLFGGQIFTFAALSRGDVSVATPLLGTKIILVTAMNALFFGVGVSMRWWVAAVLGSLSIALIASGGPSHKVRNLGLTALFSLSGAACYSLTDVVVQHWGGTFDAAAFPPVMFGITGLISLAYFGVVDRRAFLPVTKCRVFLVVGAIFFGVQIVGFFFALVESGDATSANLIYASRSVWSVAAAWAAGHLLGLRDKEAGTAVMLRRLVGALLLFGAIILILP
jgi:drug/metabolite transporter (DMT)-like permease